MLLSLDSPLIEKKKLHKRSRTVSVLVNSQRRTVFLADAKKSFSANKISRSTQIIRVKVQRQMDENRRLQVPSLQKRAEQTQKMKSQPLQGPRFSTYLNRGTSRTSNGTQQVRNPQDKASFQQNQPFQEYLNNLQNYNPVFRQPQYLTLLKKTQMLDSRSFLPHYNWKEKLNRLKNMGNYGNIYKRKDPKVHLNKVFLHGASQKERFQDYVIDSTKISLDPLEIISIQPRDSFSPSKKQCRKCHTISVQPCSQNSRRNNKALDQYQNLPYRKASTTRQIATKIATSKNHQNKGGLSERQWKFQPWDSNRDNTFS